nr:sulfatase-like hydrolase/transferase [Actibacterium sp. 188UL27-1]
MFIITDQHRTDHLGCGGNPVVRDPNIDGIAATGTRSDRFYVANPICMPNRASIMTGRIALPMGPAITGFHFRRITPPLRSCCATPDIGLG